ncbi:protein DENND6A-like [Actinia tenebrosa]|uniref:Protein DENND6A-like n=1 Tax=Actinia tenebrosa TaxID=6105 RepID=A0A6P8HIA0_ACTTE|nr:protein DENND6A-like [Actinia tenebrosa]
MAASSLEEEEYLFPNGAHVLPWDRFRRWITCFCVVTFDIEVGQAMEMVYPSHIELTEKEKTNICYLAFPDSNSGCMGDTEFHFRIRCSPQTSLTRSICGKVESAVPLEFRADLAHYYGFVYFRQVKDPSIQRGYFQKSLVLISRLPYLNLFSEVVRTLAPEFFENGLPSLEAACNNIDQWPEPEAGHTLQLPLLGNVLQVRVPSRSDKPGAVSSPDGPMNINLMTPIPSPKVIPTLKEPDTLRFLQPVVAHIHLLWELVICNEPIVVMAPTPNMCSNTVQVLVNLISPLHFCSDYRPFFTIHDSEFKEYTTRTQAPPSVILGVTNPFFAKTLQYWPHVVRIGEMSNLVVSRKSPSIGQASKRNLSSKPGIYTKYKPMLNRDKTILRKLSKGNHPKRPPEVQNAILRRHMIELTQSFMIPLERYVASLMPLQKSISPWKRPPRLKNFDIEEFIETLNDYGPQLTSKHKGNWILLYRKFFKSPNFEGWLYHRQHEIVQKLKLLHLEALGNADVLSWIQGKSEVEVVDLYLQIKEKLAHINSFYPPVSEETKTQLRQHLKTISDTFPSDLKFVLTNS